MGVFQGHQVIAILADIGWPLVWLFLLYAFKLPKVGKGMKLPDWIFLYVIALLAPNTMYAAFEIKHLIFMDGVADIMNVWSYVVFGGVSLFGLVTAIIGTRRLVNHYAKSRISRVGLMLLISLAMGFGGAIGLLDFPSLVAIVFPPTLIYILGVFFSHPFYLTIGAIASVSFFFLILILEFSRPT